MKADGRESASRQLRRSELMIATIRSLCKHGFLNSTIKTISEESGLSRGLISHYFADKDDLLTSAHQYYLQNVDDFFRHVIVSTRTGHFEKLHNAVMVPFLRDHGYHRMLCHYFSAAWILPGVLEKHRDLWARYRANIQRRIMAAARERGLDIDSRIAAITLTQLADGLWLGWVMEESYTSEDSRYILRQWLCEQFGENPDDYSLTPNVDLYDFPTRAPLPWLND